MRGISWGGGIIPSAHMHAVGVAENKRGNVAERKIFWEVNNNWKFPTFGKRHKFIY